MIRNIIKTLGIFSLLISSISCSDAKADFTLKGNIKGLKKGVVYLQKYNDSTLVTVDSLVVQGNPEFVLQTKLNEPEVLYLKLFKNDGNDYHIIPFFANKGTTEINTTLKNFSYDAIVNGSEQQQVLEDYLKIMERYKDRNLELIEQNFEALKANDTVASENIIKQSDKLFKQKYAATINFALNHTDSEVAPYLAIYEIPDTNTKYLDSIYNQLSDKVRSSKYGLQLQKVLEDRKVDLKAQ